MGAVPLLSVPIAGRDRGDVLDAWAAHIPGIDQLDAMAAAGVLRLHAHLDGDDDGQALLEAVVARLGGSS